MSRGQIGDQGLPRVLDQLCAIEGVTNEELSGARSMLTIIYDGTCKVIEVALASGDYRIQKTQYEALRNILTELCIVEGAIYTPPPPSRRGNSPQIRAAREKQKQVFDAWQETWRELRRAEKALDVEYEIAQMKDYY
ncbi:MAG: hypothetical protein CFH41_00801 [Alphaproteobacteria bacterium MarineAlpha11_Bin1]|nr:MAG: hypothetical protein CFH41_00801 [Alphaproteobacteria bacterium MarineAlpha11_Bin1]|tara:strand:+ start:11517 stop:11927 length:411 start_codon:yes stop_codon:yes gene_type:complete